DAIPTVVPSKEPPLLGSDRAVRPGTFWTSVRHFLWTLEAFERFLLVLLRFSTIFALISDHWDVFCWALSWRRRGSSSLLLHSRKLLRVSVGLFSTRILSRSLQISRPVSATRTFSGR
uniref:Uncharacterized protein n=1 Tax=Cyprinodon variegatus TaxID=28743 RepID=A0A3Q2FI09_CYPVA